MTAMYNYNFTLEDERDSHVPKHLKCKKIENIANIVTVLIYNDQNNFMVLRPKSEI